MAVYSMLRLEFSDILANSSGTHPNQETYICLIQHSILFLRLPKYPCHLALADLFGRITLKSQLQIMLAGYG